MKIFILFFLSSLLTVSKAHKILVVYPTPLLSHQHAPRAIIKGLLTAGHEIVFISPLEWSLSHDNLRNVNIGSTPEVDESAELMKQVAVDDLSVKEQFDGWLKASQMYLTGLFASEIMKNIMKNEKFDAVIVENLQSTPLLALSVHFNCASIGLISFETQPSIYREMGNPTHPILHPGMLWEVPQEPNLFERIVLLYKFLATENIVYSKYWATMDERIKEWFPHLKLNSAELTRNINLNIETVSPLWNLRPLLPNTKQIGFMHIESPKTLVSEELQSFLDSSKNGVVYVSFGCTVQGKTIGSHLVSVIKDVLESLPFNVLWKYEEDISVSENIKILKWTPQSDLLAHKNIKVFLTQGGFQSIEESIAREIPFVVIPFFADQVYNGRKVQQFGWGHVLSKNDVTVEKLRSAIMDVALNETFKANVIKSKKVMMDTVLQPVDEAVWWIEYMIRNYKTQHLKHNELPLYQYFLLDIIGVHLTAAVLVFFSLSVVFKKLKKLINLKRIKSKTD